MKKFLIAAACMFLVPFSAQAETLFEPGDVVVLSEKSKDLYKEFWKDSDGKPITEAKVLEENGNGLVTVYDPLIKQNDLVARYYLELKEPRSGDEAELPGSVGELFNDPDSLSPCPLDFFPGELGDEENKL